MAYSKSQGNALLNRCRAYSSTQGLNSYLTAIKSFFPPLFTDPDISVLWYRAWRFKMSRRYVYAVRFLIAGTVLLLGVHGAGGQVTDAVAVAVKDKAWDQLRTAWGDPDLQGIWNNTAWNATPLEYQTEEDIAETERRRRDRPKLPGAAGLAYDGDIWGEGARAGRATPPIDVTHLIIEPAGGKLPPLTTDAQQRWTARQEARRGAVSGRTEAWRLGRRCDCVDALHLARPSGCHVSQAVQQLLPHSPNSRVRRYCLRNDSRRSNHSVGRRITPSSEHAPVVGGLAWALGRRHARG